MIPTRLLAAALSDVIASAARHEDARASYGEKFFRSVESFRESISQFPQLYESVRRPPKGRDVRQGTLVGFPYIVVYVGRDRHLVRHPWTQAKPTLA